MTFTKQKGHRSLEDYCLNILLVMFLSGWGSEWRFLAVTNVMFVESKLSPAAPPPARSPSHGQVLSLFSALVFLDSLFFLYIYIYILFFDIYCIILMISASLTFFFDDATTWKFSITSKSIKSKLRSVTPQIKLLTFIFYIVVLLSIHRAEIYNNLFINLLVFLPINPKVVTSIKCPRTQSDVFKCSSLVQPTVQNPTTLH